MDRDMEKSYEGPESGPGAKYSRKGNDEVGTGFPEILETEPHTSIKSRPVFEEPWQSESVIRWKFSPTEGGTRAAWSVSGELPGYLFWMGQKDMEEMMGPDFESGLAKLKELSENAAKASPSFEVVVKEVKSKPYFYIRERIAMSEMSSEFFGMRFGKIPGHLGPDAAKVTDPPFAIFHEWDEASGETEVSVGIASASAKPESDNIARGMTYGGPTMMISYRGPYEDMGDAHNHMHKHIAASDYEFAGVPWEVFVTNPEDQPDPAERITEIYYPVRLAQDTP